MSKIMKFSSLSFLALLIPLLTGCLESDGSTNNDGRVQIALSQVLPEHDEHDDEHSDEHDEEDCHEDEHAEDEHSEEAHDEEHEESECEHAEDEHDEEHEEECEEGEHAEEEHDEAHEEAECEHADDEHGDEHDEDAHEHEEDEAHDEHEEHMALEDAAGHSVELHAAYVVLDQFQLIECSSIATALQRSLQGLIGQAYAADGHDHGHDDDRPEVPDDQRNLNRPHVIDLSSESEAPLVLGNARITEGRYCGLRLSIVPAASDAFGLPEGLSMIGTGFYIDWEQDIDGAVSDRVADSSGMALPHTMVLNFEEPLSINANTQHVVVGLHLAHLFEEVDLSTTPDSAMPAALLEGLEHALEIIDQGEGEIN